MKKEHIQKIEEQMRNLYITLLKEFVDTGLATEKQWNESVSPAMQKLSNVIRGLLPDSPSARAYKYPIETPSKEDLTANK